MELALELARTAADAGEVPVAALVVHHDQLLATGVNAPISRNDPSAHAEVLALRAAAERLGNYRLSECELFVTLEPCCMCAGAVLQARLKRVVFGLADSKTGAAGSVTNLFALRQLNHHTVVQGGLLQQACADVMRDFFAKRRQQKAVLRQATGSYLRQDALRTPEQRFAGYPDPVGESVYLSDLPSLDGLRLHAVVAGSSSAEQVWLWLHGPTDWSWIWSESLAQTDLQSQRIICPDLIGFGKSDKPKKRQFHSLSWHAQVLHELLLHCSALPIRIMAPLAMRPLVELLSARIPRAVSQTRYSQAPMDNNAWRWAPFPDSGHTAGLQAFATLLSPSPPV